MNRIRFAVVAASLVFAGTAAAQQPAAKPAKAEHKMAATADTTAKKAEHKHKKAADSTAKKVAAKSDTAAKTTAKKATAKKP